MFFGSFLQEDENEEEDFCAISPSWTFDRQTRRWRRLESAAEAPPPGGPADVSLGDRHDVCSINSCSSSSESEGQSPREAASTATATSTSDDHETSRSSSRCSSANRTLSSLSGPPSPGRAGGAEAEGRFLEKPPRKKGSSLLKKMEKLRLKESKGPNNSRTPTQRVASRPVLPREEEERVGCPPR